MKQLAADEIQVTRIWNAKFDQEMLYPVVGIDFWHPESFEDGMLMEIPF